MKRSRRPGLVALATLSAAGPAAAQVAPGVESAPWWAILLATATGPAVTYAAGLVVQSGGAAFAAGLRALGEGRGLRGAAVAAAGALERALSGGVTPQLPPHAPDDGEKAPR